MAGAAFAPGELLYEATLHFTKVTEYGLSLAGFLNGQATPPASGARIDVAFEGTISGPRLNGRITGVDYLHIRADGHVRLHIHGEIATNDGDQVAFFGEGTVSPRGDAGLLQLRENITLTTACPAYAWVNQVMGWGQGTVDPAKGEMRVTAYTV